MFFGCGFMKKENYNKIFVLFSLGGVLFSGFLSFWRLFTGSCPLVGECPYFLGYPACYFGFLMFLTLFVASLMLMFKKYETKRLLQILFYVSLLGLLFSGYFSIKELLFSSCVGDCNYALLLPTCVYGFVFYLAILITVLKYRKH